MRRPRTEVLVRERAAPARGVVAKAAMVCVIGAAGAIAACTPTSSETPAPSTVAGTGGSASVPAGGAGGGGGNASGGGGGSNPGATGSGGGAGSPATTDAAPIADTSPESTGPADTAPTTPDGPATGGTDTATGGPTFPAGTTAKIMVLGSSNETRTCWRAFLWQKLRAAGVMNFDYVGRTSVGPECTGVTGYDKDVEAAPGTIITGFKANDFAIRYKANPPDIVLVHVGGADAREGHSVMEILGAYTLAVEQGRLVNPHVAFFVGAHTPQQPMTGILELNAAIPVWAKQISKPESPVYSVDLFTGIVPAKDLSDGTHLNESGSTKVADWFLAPLLPLFKP